jgi:hypothetical protein
LPQDRCKSCRQRDRRQYQSQWRTENKSHRAHYMRSYRKTKKKSAPA